MSFKAEYTNPQHILNIFEAVNGITDIVNIHICSNSFKIEEMDESHTSFVQLEIDKSEFSKYELSSEDISYSLGINLRDLIKILKSNLNGDTLTFIYNNEVSDILSICLSGSSIERMFKLKLIIIDKQELSIPDIDYELVFDISTKLYSNIIESISFGCSV